MFSIKRVARWFSALKKQLFPNGVHPQLTFIANLLPASFDWWMTTSGKKHFLHETVTASTVDFMASACHDFCTETLLLNLLILNALFFFKFKAFQRIKGIQTGREQDTEETFALFLIRGVISLADNNKILRKGSESVAVWPYILVQL